jgi:hypothetical protein
MEHQNVRQLTRALVAVGLIFALAASAQDSRVRVGDVKVDFKTVRTPIFQSTSNPQAQSENEWLQAYVEYQTEGARRGWADEITIQWYVLVRPNNNTKPMLLQEAVTYVDVADGKHRAVMYVRPGFIRRHCDTKSTPNKAHFAAYVEISSGGKNLARGEFSRVAQPKGWWRFKEPEVSPVEGELLAPEDTPFAALDYDFYEHPKGKRQ